MKGNATNGMRQLRCGAGLALALVAAWLGSVGVCPGQTWTLTASANYGGQNGTISPVGTLHVRGNFTTNFTLSPAAFCYLSRLTVNGLAVSTQAVFHLPPVTTNTTIAATFMPILTSRGTPHFWLACHGLTNAGYEAESLLDSDGDGFANWEEWIAGTNPTNPASHQGGPFIDRLSDGTLRLQWYGKTNRSYGVWAASDLRNLTNGPFLPAGDANIVLRWSMAGSTNEQAYNGLMAYKPSDEDGNLPLTKDDEEEAFRWRPGMIEDVPMVYKPSDEDENLPLVYKPSDEDENLPLLRIRGYVAPAAQVSNRFFRLGIQRLTNERFHAP